MEPHRALVRRALIRGLEIALVLGLILVLTPAAELLAQRRPEPPTPPRKEGEGAGPFNRLIIRGVTIIDGTGAPPRGPIDIVIEGDRIGEIRQVGVPAQPIKDRKSGESGSAE